MSVRQLVDHRLPYRWRFGPIVATLTGRSCVARQESYIPGALSILPGTVPGQVRGLGHMVPTYFRRELRDRALQRPSRLRTFVFSHCRRWSIRIAVILRESGVSSTPQLRGSITSTLEYWIARRSLSSGGAMRRPGGGRCQQNITLDVSFADRAIEEGPPCRSPRQARCVEQRAARRPRGRRR